jgi:Ca-activated chloride channel homolog
MTDHKDIEEILGAAKVETTPDQDARILKRAYRALPATPFVRRLFAVAAAVTLLAVIGMWSALATREQEPAAVEVAMKTEAESLVATREQRWLATAPRDAAGGEDGGDYGNLTRRFNRAIETKREQVLMPETAEAKFMNLTKDTPVVLEAEPRMPGDPVGPTASGGGASPPGGSGGYRGPGGEIPPSMRKPMDSPPADEGQPGWDREAYDASKENDFFDPKESPLSTFSIDVDTASYANVRRILNEGRLPPAGAVRIEEFINYFSYDYPNPEGDRPFSVTTEVAVCPWNPRNRLVHVGLQGRRFDQGSTPPRNLVFLLDVSGSMRPQNKLPLVKAAMRLLVKQLREEDHVAMVVYAGASGVVLEPTSGSDQATILAALDRLSSGGSTNAGQGIQLAYTMARTHFDKEAINRVILATDGDFNVGITNRSDLEKLIEKERESGVFLTVLGVGTGNIKDSQMEMLADKGNGNYAYLDSIREAQKVLVREIGSTLVTIAKDVKIQIEFNPHRVGSYRLIGYENRVLAARDFNDDRKDAGEIGAGHSVTALYEITPPGESGKTGNVDPLKYQDGKRPTPDALGGEILTCKLRHKKPDGDTSILSEFPLRDPGHVAYEASSGNLQFSAAVAAFGMLLRDSKYKGDASFALVHELASGSLGTDPDGDRAEFLTLITKAQTLSRAR